MQLTKEKKKELFGKFGQSETNTGSPEGQVALLTQRINHLTAHLQKNKNDLFTQRALLNIVSNRKRILNYLQKKDIKRYRSVVEVLKLRK